MAKDKKKTKKVVVKKNKPSRGPVNEGRLYVNATFNNTLATVSDHKGEVLAWTSCGKVGFKGTRKSTPFAATTTLEEAVKKAVGSGIRKIQVFIKGPGPGRDAALRVLRANRSLEVTMISDVTSIPHNGPRPPKRRRG